MRKTLKRPLGLFIEQLIRCLLMEALPDRFDLFIRRARELKREPQRQLDLVLGSMFALNEWHFLNRGNQEQPEPRVVDLDGDTCLLVFSHPNKADDFTRERGERDGRDPLGLISMRPRDAVDYSLQLKEWGCFHLLVNPGPFAFMISLEVLQAFYDQWKAGDAEWGRGFWIPNMTDEEEDFWQEHGL